ncbi:RagB/SusD family nutrient uptake outer membrane protein [uncultured Aquimarina sp.]|uniref:RagB/SusD family nutrient uptake outer membrane protein n=1 Tax=uncultured Aquimarina sp. TaxID=575652 RepID=UPI002606DE00|nr:RagB/SusD family nutrient uptake outer membrane protein [uncultured Aquimarina sp.]
MKTIKILFLLSTIVSTIGCSDLEENPVGILAPESFFSSLDDLQVAVNGTYGRVGHEDIWGRKFTLTIMVRGDMVDIGDPTTAQRRIDHNDFTVLSDNGMIDDFWPAMYQTIAAANQAIAGAELLDADEAEENEIIAQAYFMRAFTYFHMVRLFGDIPYLDTPVTDIQTASSIGSTPTTEVYENIIADLEFAETWLPNTQTTRTLPAKATATSYLSLVYLTIGNYQMAYNKAKEVIDNEGTYQLGLESNFQDLFDSSKQDASQEPLFAIDFQAIRNINQSDDGTDYAPPLTGIRSDEQYDLGGGWSVAVPSLEVFDTWDDRDYRKTVSFDATGIFNGIVEPYTVFTDFNTRAVNRPHIAKYTRFIGATANGNGRASETNYATMRYAEVLLIAAEALNEINGGSEEAHQYVNRVRARARNGSDFPADASGLSQDDFRTMVLEERRLELAFEFKRWYDIARRKMGTEVFGSTGFEGQKANFDVGRDYLLPIPNEEVLRNPNLSQNDGY